MTIVSEIPKVESNTATFFQLDESWVSARGAGVTVAIVDSGIDTSHPDLQGRIVESVEARLDDKRVVFDVSDTGDSAGHGTACAGIVTRIAPGSRIYSIKVLGAEGLGDGQAFLAGLEYCRSDRAAS